MNTNLRPWLPPRRLGLVTLATFWLSAVIWTQWGGGSPFTGLHTAVWSFWIAWGLSADSGGLGGRGASKPDFPSGRAVLATVVFALFAASVMVALPVEAARAELPLVRAEWPWLLLLPVAFVMSGLALVPSESVWVRHWNAEQAARVVAAEEALASARARVLQSQMQPHFLFNALNSVTALLREDPARAKAVLLSLKGLMERSLVNAQDPMTTVGREVAFVRDQLAIEQERFHDRLQVRFEVSDDVLKDRIPAFSLQPLAENALRHGIAQSIEGGRVVVRVFRDASHLVLRVDNTGAGLDPRWREGTGFSNLRARLAFMYGHQATLSLAQTGNVTMAEIRLPLSGPRTFRAGPVVQAPGGSDR